MQAAIVCVDDEWSILKSLGSQLKRNFGKDYEIELACDGVSALALCAELTAEGKAIALIISDQRMAGMGGDALLIQLHTLYPKALKIMLTGQADADSVGNVVNLASLYRYIRKPWDETDLSLTVTEALRRFQQEQQLSEQNDLLKKINAKLASSLSLLLATLEATADGILVLDNTGIVSFNQKFVSIWHLHDANIHWDAENLLEVILNCLPDPDAVHFQALLTQADTEQHDFFSLKNGSIIEYYLQPYRLAGERVGRVWSFRDVTQEKQSEALIKHQALHDALTNLPNRVLFNQNLTAALANRGADSDPIAVLFLDLDRFKQVNDTLGHAVGDWLLQGVVERLLGSLKTGDLLARWGGDEFVLLLPQAASREAVLQVAHSLIAALRPPFLLNEHCLQVTASVGIAFYPDDGLDSQTLLANADVALYRAKTEGRNTYETYSNWAD